MSGGVRVVLCVCVVASLMVRVVPAATDDGAPSREDQCRQPHGGFFTCKTTSGRVNPCSPSLCKPGVTEYRGFGNQRYVQCNNGQCEVKKCGKKKDNWTWDDENKQCVSARCAGGKTSNFDCTEARNPCSPDLCFKGQTTYRTSNESTYVSCTGGASGNECEILDCEAGTRYSAIKRGCVDETCLREDDFDIPEKFKRRWCCIISDGTSLNYTSADTRSCWLVPIPEGKRAKTTIEMISGDDKMYMYTDNNYMDTYFDSRRTHTYVSPVGERFLRVLYGASTADSQGRITVRFFPES